MLWMGMCAHVCSHVYMHVYMHTVPEEEAGNLEAKATNSCELPDMGAGNSSPLQRQYMLLTPEPPLQSSTRILMLRNLPLTKILQTKW